MELPGCSVSMNTTLMGNVVSKPLDRLAQIHASISDIQFRNTKLRKSGSLNLEALHMFNMLIKATFLGRGLLASSVISRVNSFTDFATKHSSTTKKFSGRMCLSSAASTPPRTLRHVDVSSSNALSISSLSADILCSSSAVKRPSAADRVLFIRQLPMAITSFSTSSRTSFMTLLWLSSKPSRTTHNCTIAKRVSKSLNIWRWSCMRFRTTPAEPQSKNSHQALSRSEFSEAMSARHLSSWEFHTLILRVFLVPQ
mmetsp:Transcript_26581/g.62017  ORF Transcript_26581/g.62017 Transcript_26581/m.62017 type:complete len:255 (-) Transcript_26581:925-1689(-)